LQAAIGAGNLTDAIAVADADGASIALRLALLAQKFTDRVWQLRLEVGHELRGRIGEVGFAAQIFATDR
jgi:hypothetical protein